jgi:hypothetical protein
VGAAQVSAPFDTGIYNWRSDGTYEVPLGRVQILETAFDLVRWLLYAVPYMPELTQPPKAVKESGTQRYSRQAKQWFYEEVKKGYNPYRLGEMIGASRPTVRKWMKQLNQAYGDASPIITAKRVAIESTPDGEFPDPRTSHDQLVHPQAKQAWVEFGYWRNLYLARRHIPWQIEMVQILMSWWEAGQLVKGTSESEVIKGIVNTPPGGGKSTTITHDFPGWLITRDRNIRIALGARTSPQSIKYVRRLRATLEKNILLNIHYGRYKPLEPEEWRANAFIVDGVTGHEATMDYKLALAGFDPQHPETKHRLEDPDDDIHTIIDQIETAYLTGEKESTVAALSQDMGFLGGRFDVNLWDDLADKNNSRTPDQRDALINDFWFPEAESRCEPGGLVGLIGTRFGKFDIYHHCKNLTYQADNDVDEKIVDAVTSSFTEEEMIQVREDLEKELVDKYGQDYSTLATPDVDGMRMTRKVYRYYKFPAHDEAKCQNPSSLKNADHIECVLDPKRFSYQHLRKVQAADARKFELTYQQNDESTAENLVQKVWLTGGTDEQNVHYTGCYNYDRQLWQIPEDLKKEDCFSIATVDPSAQNWWSIQWWLYDTVHDMDYLIALQRARLTSGGFLDYEIQKRRYSGVAQDWVSRAAGMGWPISLWIIEQAAAQRYIFQHKWVYEWMKEHHTTIKGHETNRNKADPELGVEASLPARYRLGKVDLPYNQDHLPTRVTINEFAKELTEYPDSQTDDMVMGNWFFDFNRLILPDSMRVSRATTPVRHIYADSLPEYMVNQDIPKQGGHRAVQEARRRRAIG